MSVSISLLVLIIVIIAIGLIVGLVYKRSYSKRINRVLEEGDSTAHSDMAEPVSVAKVILIILGIIAILSLFGMLSRLETRLAELETKIESVRTEINSNIGYTTGIVERIESSTELVRTGGVWYGDYNSETGNITVGFRVYPTRFSKDTSVSVNINNRQVELKYDNGSFYGEGEFPVFGNYFGDPIVMFDNNGEIQTEVCYDLSLGNMLEFTGMPIYRLDNISIGTYTKGNITSVNLSGYMYNNSEGSNDREIVCAVLQRTVGGTSVETKDITEECRNNAWLEYEFEIKEDAEGTADYGVDIVYTDSKGYEYLIPVYHRYQDERIYDYMPVGVLHSIRDASGKLIYEAEEFYK